MERRACKNGDWRSMVYKLAISRGIGYCPLCQKNTLHEVNYAAGMASCQECLSKETPRVEVSTTFASEAKFQQAIIDFAHAHSWKVYHTHDSRHSEPGFPDLFMVRPTREDEFVEAVVLECKLPGKKLTKAQAEWLELLNRVPGVRARVVYPGDWPEIAEILK